MNDIDNPKKTIIEVFNKNQLTQAPKTDDEIYDEMVNEYNKLEAAANKEDDEIGKSSSRKTFDVEEPD